jgi:hypothetical protein
LLALHVVWRTHHIFRQCIGFDCQFGRCCLSVDLHNTLHSICRESEKGCLLIKKYTCTCYCDEIPESLLCNSKLSFTFPLKCCLQIRMFGLLLAVFGLCAIIVAGSLQIIDSAIRRMFVGFLSGASLISMFASPLFIIVSLSQAFAYLLLYGTFLYYIYISLIA